MRLGDIIKQYRVDNGLSMLQFAEKSGISKAYIGLLEKGTHPKTGNPIHPSVEKIYQAAAGMDMDFDTLFKMIDEYVTLDTDEDIISALTMESACRIPVLGKVAAGIPIDAIEDIIDYIYIPSEISEHGEFYGLIIKGDSMEPQICNKDTVIVLKTASAESGDIVIATLGNDDAVCKKYIKRGKKTFLHSLNASYEDIDVTDNPDFSIWGVVTELRRSIKKL